MADFLKGNNFFDDELFDLDNDFNSFRGHLPNDHTHQNAKKTTFSLLENINIDKNHENCDPDVDNPSSDEEAEDNCFIHQEKFRDSDRRKVRRRTSSDLFVVNRVHGNASVKSADDGIFMPATTENIQKQGLSKTLSSTSTTTDDESQISSGNSASSPEKQHNKTSSVDGLLFEIYDHHHQQQHHHFESDFGTECSTTSVTSVYVASSFENDDRPKLDWSYLETKEIQELEKMVRELKRGTNMLSSKLVRLLKQRDRNAHKVQENFNVLTALLQAVSPKRRVDTRIRFSFIPRPGKRGFRQWVDAVKAIGRIHPGIPHSWRKRTWLSLAEYFLKDVDWEQIKKFCFNDRRNPDDDQLDTQIVKDLHRTGCGWFFEHDTPEDRASLKRVLLGYARWNKSVGYCQGFNVIAALILQVMEGSEEHALKVMIYVVDYVLPRNYFSNNLRALSVDMAVLRDLMAEKLPDLSTLLQKLQSEAMNSSLNTSASYEPPLINMFTMQWFLTLFATCLPRNTVLRVWDTVLLEGSEVLLRVALVLWQKLSSEFDHVKTAPDFYMQMGKSIRDLIEPTFFEESRLIRTVYEMELFPWTKVTSLREKYTYDIHPFATFKSDDAVDGMEKKTKMGANEIDEEQEDFAPGCLSFVGHHPSIQHDSPRAVDNVGGKPSFKDPKNDITRATPGAYSDADSKNAYERQIREMEQQRVNEKLDVNALRSQYGHMRRLQQKAMLVFNCDNFKKDTAKTPPSAINHLFVDVTKVAPPRMSYVSKKPNKQFPALKTLGKGVVPPLKPPRVTKNTVVRDVIQEESNQDLRSPLAEFPASTVKVHSAKTTENECSVQSHFPNSHTLNKTTSKTTPFEKSTSILYHVDRSAVYPPNFKPFPHRNTFPKKNLAAK